MFFLFLQVIAFLYTAMRCVDLGLRTALIVVPVNVLHNWRQEFLKWRPSEVKPLRVFMLEDVSRFDQLYVIFFNTCTYSHTIYLFFYCGIYTCVCMRLYGKSCLWNLSLLSVLRFGVCSAVDNINLSLLARFFFFLCWT